MSVENCYRSFRSLARTGLVVGCVLALLLVLAQRGMAQPIDAVDPAAQPVPVAVPAPVTSAYEYPAPPRSFVRGNGLFGGQAGYYFNLWKIALVIGILALWARIGRFVHSDASALKVRNVYWNTVVFLSGLAGFFVVICLPRFIYGFILLLISNVVPLGLYVKERNAKVPEASRIFTPKQIRNVVMRQLIRMGIRVGSEEIQNAAVGPEIVFVGKSGTGGKNEPDRSRQVESSKGYLAAKELVYDSILRRSTDIHLEPNEDGVAVRLRIDGVMYPTEPFDKVVGEAVINIFKVLGGMDITEKRRPQDGSFSAEMEEREIDFRLATQGTRHGEKMSMRILDQAGSVSELAQLGLRKGLQVQLEEIIHQPHGLFLSCGPTGAGKSTTLYAALNAIDAYQRNIITIEDPVEYKMKNITQIEVNTKSGQTFATALRSILRQDPDVVMVGEIRDGETAKIACQASTTGHMVFSTLHANDTITALFRLVDLGVEPFLVASSMSGILGQRLARRLCPDCKEAYRPKPEFLQKAHLPADKIDVLYRPPKNPEFTCENCGGLGYKGRIGVVELLVVNDRIRDMIRENASMSSIKAEARKNGMLYMKEEGLRLVAKGVTSVEELLRVVK